MEQKFLRSLRKPHRGKEGKDLTITKSGLSSWDNKATKYWSHYTQGVSLKDLDPGDDSIKGDFAAVNKLLEIDCAKVLPGNIKSGIGSYLVVQDWVPRTMIRETIP